MRKIRLFAFLGLLACTSLTTAQDSDMEIRARTLVSDYFAALMQGDTQTVLSLIGGEFLSSRQQLLENPEYSSYLSNNYLDASATVTGSSQVAANRVEVDVSIQKSPEEQFAIVLLVESMDTASEILLIIDERDSAN